MPQDLSSCWNQRKLKALIPHVVVFVNDQPSAERRIDFAVFFIVLWSYSRKICLNMCHGNPENSDGCSYLLTICFISLACVSSETHNLRRVFRPGVGGKGVVPYIGYMDMCGAKGYVFFSRFDLKQGISFDHFGLKIGYGLCPLVLNWVCVLEELATSSSFGDHFLFNVYANYRVRAVTACHALRSRTGLQGFSSELGYQIFDHV